RERARVDSLRNSEFFHRSQHVPSADDIDPLSHRWVFRPDLLPACNVEHRVNAGHRAAQGIRIRGVSATDIDTDGDQVLGALRIPRNRDDIVAGVDQLPGDTTADEARGARHEILRHRRLAPETKRLGLDNDAHRGNPRYPAELNLV